MAPKIKITKNDIISTAIAIVREKGSEALNARAVASSLECSTQPIFSNFKDMNELKDSIILAAYDIYLNFIKKGLGSEKYPKYKSFGMSYIQFAKEEKELFKLLFMRDRSGEDISPSSDFEESVQMIMQANGVSDETARLIHLEMWSCVHGIAVMTVTSFLSLERELISDMLTDVYRGLCANHLSEGNKNAGN